MAKESTAPASAETRRFSVHPAILYSVIEKQCGTLGKAILELIMNSVDAGATKVDIVMDGKRFSVSDDGKGFADMDEIVNFFETFGTPHEDGDATYGRFRIGRGQIFSFSANIWRSGSFLMDVDIKNRGLDYHLQTGLPEQKGCHIEGTLYDKVLPSDYDTAMKEIRDLAAYVQIPVALNGKRVNRLPAECKWDHETDEAYFSFKSVGPLRVYNLGVLVRDYSASNFGVSGTVVSKMPLNVNFARNDVLVSNCPVWKKIRKDLDRHVGKTVVRKSRLNDDERQNLITRMLCGNLTLDEVGDTRIITDLQGRAYSVCDWLNITVDLLMDPPDEASRQIVVERAHMLRMVHALSQKTLEMFGADDTKEFLGKISKVVSKSRNPYLADRIKRFKIVPYEYATKSIKEGLDYIKNPAKELDLWERCALHAIKNVNRDIHWRVLDEVPECGEVRDIRVGISDTNHGWTDGSTYICVNRRYLEQAKGGFAGFFALASLLVHEYVHGTPDTESHMHDFEFYRAFHEIMANCAYGIADIAERMMNQYVKELRRHGKKPGMYASRSMDSSAKANPGGCDGVPEEAVAACASTAPPAGPESTRPPASGG